MQRRTILLGCVGVAGAFGAALDAGADQAVPLGAHATRVADAERSFARSMAQRDVSAFASHISSEAIFTGGGNNARVLRGKPAVVDGWRAFFEGPTAPFSWEPDVTEVTDSGTLALTSGPVHDPSGKLVGRFNSVWRLEPDGVWRVVFDRGSPVCS